MNWKEFLKPSVIKIAIMLIIFLIFFFTYPDYYFIGLPEEETGWVLEGEPIMGKPVYSFNFGNLFFNLIVFYFLSCLITWFYDNKLKKK